MLNVLRQRNFGLLWVGQLISLIGDWVLVIALPFYIYDVTGSALATGAMFIAASVPRLFGSFAGVFVDRWDRRWIMIITDLARALLMLSILLARTGEWIWIIYVVAFIESLVGQFFNPAKSAIIPQLVGEQDLVPANSLDAFSDAITRLIGPSLGGALFGWLGITSIISADSISYLVSGLLILLIVMPKQEKVAALAAPASATASWQHVWSEWLAGLRLVGRVRLLTVLFVGIAIMMVSEGISQVLIVPFVKIALHGGAATFGWLVTAQGVGALAGSLLLGWLGRVVRPKILLIGSMLSAGLGILVVVNFPLLWLDLGIFLLIGASVVGFMVSSQTLLQNSVVDEYRGRVFGAFGTVIAVTMLLGMGLASAFSGLWGVLLLMNIGGCCFLLGGLALLWMPNPVTFSSEAAEVQQSENSTSPVEMPV